MLQSASGSDSVGLNRSGPLQIKQVKNEQVIEPGLAVAAAEDKHQIVDDACSVELPHRGFPYDHAWNIKGKFFYSFF